MRLQILYVPDCPNTGLLRARLEQALTGQDTVDVQLHVIHDQDEATAFGMTGSPTLLIDGVDPFAEAGQPTSMSCRLYPDQDGAVCRTPSVAELRAAITHDTPPGHAPRQRQRTTPG